MSEESYTRSSIRFSAENNSLTLIDLERTDDDFKPSAVGLAIDESSHGSGIVMLKKNCPEMDREVRVQVGKLAPLKAKVVWVKELDEHVVRVGFHFLE